MREEAAQISPLFACIFFLTYFHSFRKMRWCRESWMSWVEKKERLERSTRKKFDINFHHDIGRRTSNFFLKKKIYPARHKVPLRHTSKEREGVCERIFAKCWRKWRGGERERPTRHYRRLLGKRPPTS